MRAQNGHAITLYRQYLSRLDQCQHKNGMHSTGGHTSNIIPLANRCWSLVTSGAVEHYGNCFQQNLEVE